MKPKDPLPRKSAASEGADGREDFGKLMAKIDSPAGWDPMPVEHHEFPMKHPELIDTHVMRLMSYLYSYTIRRKNRPRSAAAVDSAKKYITIERIEQDLEWSLDWTARKVNQAIRYGLLRRGTGKSGDFPTYAFVLVGRVKPQETGKLLPMGNQKEPFCTLRKFHSSLSEKQLAQWSQLEEEKREEVARREEAALEQDDLIIADAMWQARKLVRERKYTRFVEYGIDPDVKAAPRRDHEPVVELQLRLFDRDVHSAEYSEADNGAYSTPGRSVPAPVSLLGSKGSSSKENLYREGAAAAAAGAPAPALYQSAPRSAPNGTNGSPPPPTPPLEIQPFQPDEWKRVRDLLHKMDHTATAAQVSQLVANCREKRDGLAPEDLAKVIASLPLGKINSAIAYFSKQLPEILSNDQRMLDILQNPVPLRFNNGHSRDRERQEENDRIAAGLEAAMQRKRGR